MRLARATVAIAFCIAGFPAAQAPVARPLVPEDTLATSDIGEIAVSPDGGQTAFIVSRANVGDNRVDTQLMLLGVRDAKPRPVGLGGSSIRWSPDGKRIALLQDGSDGRSWLIIVDPATGLRGKVVVCAVGRSNSFLSKAGSYLAWSPDGTRVAFAGTAEPAPSPADPLVVTRLQYKTRTAFSDNRRTHVFVVDAKKDASPKQLTVGEFDDHSIAWGGDGSEIVFLSNRGEDPDANLNYDIYAVNVVTGALRRITDTPGVEMDPTVSPDGRWIAYTATTRSVTTIDSVAEDAHVFVVPVGGGSPHELNHALDRRSANPEWAPDSASVLFSAVDHGKALVYRVPVTGGAARPLFEREAQAAGISVARDGTIVFGMTDPSMPREVFKLPPGGATPVQMTRLNIDYLAPLTLVKPETLHFKSFDGTEIEGWLYPALDVRRAGPATGDGHRPSGGKTPLILSIHGGPHGAYGYGFSPAFQLNASRGYATLAINPRGSSGYGQAFSDGCVNNWGGGDYKDLMAGVDYVLKSHPNLDADRLGVMGGSYGGFMTNWVITQTSRFKAAVSIASLSNMISFYATSLYQDLVHAEFGGFPWDDDHYATLWKWSPLAHVKSVVTPTLFIHGEQDNDVHITQAEEMFTALRRRGIEAVFARYPREGHGFREPKHRLDSTTRALAWMDRFLMPEPATQRP